MDTGISQWGEQSPAVYVNRFAELVTEAHEPATTREVAETLVARDGPLEEVVWFALDGYDDHVITYRGANPDQHELRRLHSFSPSEQQMPQLKSYLNQHYTSQEVDHAAVIEIPDTYNPHLGQNPGIRLGAYHHPETDQIQVGFKPRPLRHYERVIEDVGKLVPADDIEDFLDRIGYQLGEELQEEADQRLITGDIGAFLEADSNFRCETTTSIPERTHPEYEGMEAELWQKPISKVDGIDSSQGFLQVWRPLDEPDTGVVATTKGDYQERTVIEAVCERFKEWSAN